MNKILERPLLAISILVIICSYLFFFRLGSVPLTDPDETFYAQTAKEMLNANDWTTPCLYGKPQFEKPILIYWLIKASYMAFGVNETAARLPSAAFGLLGVIAMYFLGNLLFGKKAGFISALILATNVEYVIISRACINDMVLNTCMLAGVLFFFYGYVKEKSFYYILSSIAFALATLAKGPIAIMLPVFILLVFLALSRDLGALRKVPFALCFTAFVFVAGPWYFAAYKLHGREFIDAFFGFQNVTRFMQSEHKIGSQFYYNVPIILGGFFPWSVFLPLGLWAAFKKSLTGKMPERGNNIFILTWFFAIFIFFSISKTKLPTYVFPSFISLALMTGVLWSEFLKGSLKTAEWFKFSYRTLIYIACVGAVAAAVFAYIDMPDIFTGTIVSGVFLVAGFAVSAAAFKRQAYAAAFFLIIASLAAFLVPVQALVLPQVERYESSREVSGKLLSMMKDGQQLGSQSNYLPGLAFYTDKFAKNLDGHEDMIRFFNSEGRVWCVIKDKNHAGLYDPKVNNEYVRTSYLVYKLGKRAIITNQMPDDGKFIIKREYGK